jgi:hypothetical protein
MYLLEILFKIYILFVDFSGKDMRVVTFAFLPKTMQVSFIEVTFSLHECLSTLLGILWLISPYLVIAD